MVPHFLDCAPGEVVEMPREEVRRRLECTTREWPVAMVHIPGYGRDRLMSTHRSNHITVCYGTSSRSWPPWPPTSAST